MALSSREVRALEPPPRVGNSRSDDVINNNQYLFHNPGGGDRFEVGVYDAAAATTRWGVFVIRPNANVGIGTVLPTERLHVAGNLRFDGALMPNNQPGLSGQVLTSAGPATPPTWTWPYFGAIYRTALTAVASTTSSTYVDIPGMSITFMPRHNRVYVFASLATRLTDNNGFAQHGQAIAGLRILVNSTPVTGTKALVTD